MTEKIKKAYEEVAKTYMELGMKLQVIAQMIEEETQKELARAFLKVEKK